MQTRVVSRTATTRLLAVAGCWLVVLPASLAGIDDARADDPPGVAASASDPTAAADARAGYPDSVDFGVVDAASPTSVAVDGLPGEDKKPVHVGYLTGAGEAVRVTRTGDTLAVASLPRAGEYSGTVDLGRRRW